MLLGNIHWGLASASLVLAFSALILANWALFRDKSRGRRRCSSCWYDMAGASGLICPECGRAAKHEHHLFRARRHPVRAALIVAFAWTASYYLLVIPARIRAGERSTRWIPSTILIVITPIDDSVQGIPVGIFHRNATLWGWQRDLLQYRERLVVTPDQLRASIKTRPVWPLGAVVRFEPSEPRILTFDGMTAHFRSSGRPGLDAAVDVMPPLVPRIPSTWPADRMGGPRRSENEFVGLPLGAHRIPVTCTLTTTNGRSRAVSFDIDITVVEPSKFSMNPIDTPKLREQIASTLTLAVSPDRDAPAVLGSFDLADGPNPFLPPSQSYLPRAVTLEILDGDNILFTRSMPRGISGLPLLTSASDDPNAAFFTRIFDKNTRRWNQGDLARMTLRVSGDPIAESTRLASTECWSGSYTVPLLDVLKLPGEPR